MNDEIKAEILKGAKLGFSAENIALALGISEEEVKTTLDAEVNKNEEEGD